MGAGSFSGGIVWLLKFGSDHPSAIRADFRGRYGVSFDEAGLSYTWKEAVYLAQALLTDTSSLSQAALHGWKYPASREWMMLTELYDLTVRIHSKGGKAKPVPRPWPNQDAKRAGNSTHSREAVLRNLERMNPEEP